MKILSECALCRMGMLTKVPLCMGYRNPLVCVWRSLFPCHTFNQEKH